MCMTAQQRVGRTIPLRGGGVIPDQVHNDALHARTRFSFEFTRPLPAEARDPAMREILRCTGCYARWVESAAGRRLPPLVGACRR